MTVAELIEKLKEMPQDLPVVALDDNSVALTPSEIEAGPHYVYIYVDKLSS